MKEMLENAISNELIFVYGLIALVIILIIVIVIIDRKESKQKPKSLFDTLNMKIISNLEESNHDDTERIEEPQSISNHLEMIEINHQEKTVSFQDLEPIPEVNPIASGITENNNTLETKREEKEDIYIETDLEKTQAQIRVEEITNALKNAQVEEQIQEDKYSKFEEEQEKNAIISYEQLKDSFDKLYSENEKIQYLEDDEIPINIEELYQLKKEKQVPIETEQTVEKVKMEDLSNFSIPKREPQSTSTFKSSPVISPVYGIQKEEPPVVEKKNIDIDIQNTNQFLQTLKELKNNLD